VGELKVKAQEKSSIATIIILAGGDLLALLLFVWVGRSSHAMALTDIGAVLATAGPFIIAWFLVTPWFGLFKAEVSQNWQQLLPRLLIAWLIIGGPLALVLRALFLGRPLLAGIIPVFAAVTLAFTTLFLLIWRLAYAWWATARLNRAKGSEGLDP
jgi:hypothetical protein